MSVQIAYAYHSLCLPAWHRNLNELILQLYSVDRNICKAALCSSCILLLGLNTLTKSHLGGDVIWLILPGRNPSPRELRARTHGRKHSGRPLAGLLSGSSITSFLISFLKYNSGPPAQEWHSPQWAETSNINHQDSDSSQTYPETNLMKKLLN